MAIVKMKRLRVIAMAEDREPLLRELMHLGCVEITEPADRLSDGRWTALLRRAGSDLVGVRSRITDVNAALDAIKRYAQVKDGLFVARRPISEREFLEAGQAEDAKASCEKVNGLLGRLSRLASEHNRTAARRAGLVPWAGLDCPLELPDTEHVLFRMCVCPAATDVGRMRADLADAAAELLDVSADKEQHYLFLLSLRQEEERVLELLRPYGVSMVSFRECTGTASENLDALATELLENEAEQERVMAELAACKDARDALRIYADALTAEAACQSSGERLLTNGTVVFFEGWAPAEKLGELEALFAERGCAWETADPEPEEEPPVLLANPKWMRPINMVTEMYSLPAYRGIDPNPLIFWFFVFFFGFMFADVAYGLIIFAVCRVIERKYRPKNTMGYMFRLGQYMGLSTTICGVFTGGFFGDLIPKFTESMLGLSVDQLPGWFQVFNRGIIVNPINDPMTALLLSVAIGAVHLVFGQCIHVYMGFRDAKGPEALLDALLDVVPWWLFFGSIGLVAAGFTPWCIALGAVLLVATQGHTKRGFLGKLMGGVASLYDVTSWLSDILSYTRLMALMLATSVIASVMNTLGTLGGLSVGGIILFVAVFIIGHVFNIGVNVIGTYVHAARLQYLEFFGKFYEEGGAPFQPLRYDTKYVDIQLNEEEKVS